MIYYHGHILILAKKAYERSLSEGTESFVSITLSAMALECYLNDFTHQISSDLLKIGIKPLKDLAFVLDALEESRATIINKIETVHFLLTAVELDRGSKDHQDLSMLVRLRNGLVHRKPESTGDWGVDPNQIFEPHKFVKFFSDRGVIERPNPESPPVWSQYLNKPDVARWAFNTVVNTIKGIVGVLPESHFADIQNLMTKGMSKI